MNIPHLSVSADRRSITNDGKPWVLLGDTAWELFHRPSADDVEHYLATRARQGFNLVLACALAELDGLRVPDHAGNLPFVAADPARPVEAYWAQIDRTVAAANRHGLIVGLLPTWGDKWNTCWGTGPLIFREPAVAHAYGTWIGRRYRDHGISWVMGGDRPFDTPGQAAVIDAMAAGIRSAVGDRHLMTFHPRGNATSGDSVHDRPWLDFNLAQSGHAGWDAPNYEFILRDRARSPVKPCLDGEPRYEHHPVMLPNWKGRLAGHRFTDHDVRLACWHAWTAGACGHVYGCHAIWQFHDPARHGDGVNDPGLPWREALLLPGADRHMGIWHRLASTRSGGEPDDSLRRTWQGAGRERIGCLRAADRSWAVLYLGVRRKVQVDGRSLAPEQLRAAWLDPRTGERTELGIFPRLDLPEWLPPEGGPDWALLLDPA